MDKRPLKVFLCHAHADRDAVRALYTRLINDGVDAWLDKAKLLPGQDWELEIKKAVREADVVVVCLSKQFNQAGFRQKEVRLALDTAMEEPEGEIFIIPARLEECDNLESLRKWHWVDLFEEDGQEMLMRALRRRADNIGATLHIKKSWLPIVNTQPVGVKKPSTPMERPVEKKQVKPKPKKEIKGIRIFNKTTIGIAGFVVLVLAAIVGLRPLIGKPDPTSTATNTASLKTFTPIPATPCSTASGNWDVYVVKTGDTVFSIAVSHNMTVEELLALNCISENNQIVVGQELLIPKASQTEVPLSTTSTVTPLPTEITDAKGVTMRLVPAGEFTMGNLAENAFNFCENIKSNIENFGQACNVTDYLHEEPIHKVYINDFFMDIFEVSNEEYKKCVLAGECMPPSSNNANGYSSYYNNDYLVTYPVLNVTWNMAEKYCKWRGARLPTEAEWEKAARGVDERSFPWGSNTSSGYIFQSIYYSNRANVNLNPRIFIATVPISSNSKGLSPYGMYNMAGNVAEWVNDWYGDNYYLTSPYENPTGPGLGESKVIRGGSVNDRDVRTTARGFMVPTEFDTGVGFRCAMDAP